MTMISSSDKSSFLSTIKSKIEDKIDDVVDTDTILENEPKKQRGRPRKNTVPKNAKAPVLPIDPAKRVNSVDIIAGVLASVFGFIDKKYPDNPTIAIYKFQSPAIAYLLDQKIAGSKVDNKILQPLNKFKISADFQILGLPGMMELYMQNQNPILEAKINFAHKRTLFLNKKAKELMERQSEEIEKEMVGTYESEGLPADFNFAKETYNAILNASKQAQAQENSTNATTEQ